MNFDDYLKNRKGENTRVKGKNKNVQIVLSLRGISGHRGQTVGLSVSPDATAFEILQKGAKLFRENYVNFEQQCPTPHDLLLHEGLSAFEWRDGNFTLSAYKNAMGKDYKKLTFYVTPLKIKEDVEPSFEPILSMLDEVIDLKENNGQDVVHSFRNAVTSFPNTSSKASFIISKSTTLSINSSTSVSTCTSISSTIPFSTSMPSVTFSFPVPLSTATFPFVHLTDLSEIEKRKKDIEFEQSLDDAAHKVKRLRRELEMAQLDHQKFFLQHSK